MVLKDCSGQEAEAQRAALKNINYKASIIGVLIMLALKK
jgi:hypothetical protein